MEQAPPPGVVRWLGYTAAAWCLGFAGVSVWLVAGMAGEPGHAGLVILSVAALVLKLAGAADFGVLAVWFHRRHHLGWTSAVAGLAGAPLLLGLLLGVAPAILARWDLLPT